jgi:hypothetical protein
MVPKAFGSSYKWLAMFAALALTFALLSMARPAEAG